MFRRKVTIELRYHGADSKTSHHWWGTTEEDSRTVIKISTSNPERDLPRISQLLEGNIPQSPPRIESKVNKTIDTNVLPFEREQGSSAKPKRRWFG
jgi:hypothetical protein